MEDAREFEAAIRKRMPGIQRLALTSIGTALGVHGGPGTLIVSMMPHLSADDIPADID